MGTRKVERLQKREQAAEYIAACESEKGPLRLDRILSKQKNRRDEIGNANDGLNDRNKNVKTCSANVRERQTSANTTDKRVTMPDAAPRCCALTGSSQLGPEPLCPRQELILLAGPCSVGLRR